jgi:hypothetical protein
MPYVSDDHYLKDPRSRPDVQPQYTTNNPHIPDNNNNPSSHKHIVNNNMYFFPDSPSYTPQEQHTLFPDPSSYTQQQQTIFPNPPSYTPQQQHIFIPQPQSYIQPYSDSDYMTQMPNAKFLRLRQLWITGNPPFYWKFRKCLLPQSIYTIPANPTNPRRFHVDKSFGQFLKFNVGSWWSRFDVGCGST